MTEQLHTHRVRAEGARAAWSGLPHGGHGSAVLHVQCGSSPHVATVYETDSGLVYRARVRARSHGSGDRFDEPHGGHEAESWFDYLAVEGAGGTDDALPAWCDCGHRTLSRSAVIQWLQAGDHRVVVD